MGYEPLIIYVLLISVTIKRNLPSVYIVNLANPAPSLLQISLYKFMSGAGKLVLIE